MLTARYQSDRLELRFSRYRQMSGGRFLVSLCEVQHSERIIAIDSLLKEEINFWDEDLRPDVLDKESMRIINEEICTLELAECQLSEDTTEVGVTIAGYVAKILENRSKCAQCEKRLKAGNEDPTHCDYLNTLSRGGLITPSTGLADFVCHVFSVLDSISPILMKHSRDVSHRKAAENVLGNMFDRVSFMCDAHVELGKKWSIRTAINIFFNNKQKMSNDEIRKDQVVEFKQRQRQKDY